MATDDTSIGARESGLCPGHHPPAAALVEGGFREPRTARPLAILGRRKRENVIHAVPQIANEAQRVAATTKSRIR